MARLPFRFVAHPPLSRALSATRGKENGSTKLAIKLATKFGVQGTVPARILSGGLAEALPVLRSVCRRRLLGDHVPYAWESEMGKVHLATESTLYCRLMVAGEPC